MSDLRRDEVFAQIAAVHDLRDLLLRKRSGDDAFIFYLVIGCVAVEIVNLCVHMRLLLRFNVQVFEDSLRQVLVSYNKSAAARCAVVRIQKYLPDCFIVNGFA